MVYAIFSDCGGNIYEDTSLDLMGRLGRHLIRLSPRDLIDVPAGSDFFFMPDDRMVGWDSRTKQPQITNRTPVAVLLPPGYIRTYLPASVRQKGGKTLPQWAYTACGFEHGRVVTAAIKIDESPFWDPTTIDPGVIKKRADQKLKQMPKNRIVEQLRTCAVQYGCMTARNFVLERHEAALPVSPACNASCIGCLSWQAPDTHTSSHNRISFVPTVDEIVAIAVPHLEGGPKRIVSFGQGCEGEPLLQSDLVEKAIRQIRKKTSRGTIHMNTNGALPSALERLIQAGLDSVRISANSAAPETYAKYFRPKGFGFDDVIRSMKIAKKNGTCLSINLLLFPGISDETREAQEIVQLCRQVKPNLLQLRNLNIDPELYLDLFPYLHSSECMGIAALIKQLSGISDMAVGCFNRPKEEWHHPHPNPPPSRGREKS